MLLMRVFKAVRIFCGIVTLVALFAPSFHFKSEHHHHHHENDHSDCSPKLEKDACHRRLVHHDFSAECGHDGHLTESNGDCALCDYLLANNHYQPNYSFIGIANWSEPVKLVDFRCYPQSRYTFGYSGRGPPARV